MQTWVLLVFALTTTSVDASIPSVDANRSITITNIPGYEHEEDCVKAANAVFDLAGMSSKFFHVQVGCIPGPKK
jgi:hypothetical protein